jgi:hypothetical protein
VTGNFALGVVVAEGLGDGGVGSPGVNKVKGFGRLKVIKSTLDVKEDGQGHLVILEGSFDGVCNLREGCVRSLVWNEPMLSTGDFWGVNVLLFQHVLKYLFESFKEEAGQADGAVRFGFMEGTIARFFEENCFGFTPDTGDIIKLEAAVK